MDDNFNENKLAADELNGLADSAEKEPADDASDAVDETAGADDVVDETAGTDDVLDGDEENAVVDDDLPTEAAFDTAAEEINLDAPVKGKKKKKRAALIVILVLLIALIAGTITAYFMFSVKKPKIDMNKTILSVGDVDSSVMEFISFYQSYSSYYSYYGQSVDSEGIKDDVLEDLAHYNALYRAAKDEGLELTAEQKKNIEDAKAQLLQAAEQESMNADEMLENYYGKGYTSELYGALIEKQTYANAFVTRMRKSITDSFDAGEKDGDIQNEYKDNRKEYDLCNFSYCYFENADGEGEKFAKNVTDALAKGTAFDEAVKAAGSDATAKPLTGYGYQTLSSNFDKDIADFVFAQDDKGEYTSVAGKYETFKKEGVVYVIFINAVPARNEAFPVTVDYAYFEAGTSDIKTDEELALEAKAKANAFYKRYQEAAAGGLAGAEALQTASAAGDDTPSIQKFESVTDATGMDSEVSEWIFDKARKVGDSAVVQSSGGTYVLVFSDKSQTAAWYNTIKASLVEKAVTEWEDSFRESYQDELTVNDDVVAEAVDYLNAFNETAAAAE